MLYSCSEDEVVKDCGCNSNTTAVIPQTEEWNGTIGYKTQLETKDDYYNNTYWIEYSGQNCVNCILIVCNEDMISDLNLQSSETVKVKFTGNLKEICNKIHTASQRGYKRIVLTQIEIQ